MGIYENPTCWKRETCSRQSIAPGADLILTQLRDSGGATARSVHFGLFLQFLRPLRPSTPR